MVGRSCDRWRPGSPSPPSGAVTCVAAPADVARTIAGVDLERALEQFDRTQTNLERLQKVWDRMQELIPSGIAFSGAGPDELLYDELSRAFYEITAGLPAIDGRGLDCQLITLSEIAKARYDADLLDDDPEVIVALTERIEQPVHAIADYRHRLTKARKRLVRERVIALVAEIDGLLAGLAPRHEPDGHSVADDPDWGRLHDSLKELDRLTGQDVPRKGRWGELARHLGFAMGVDLRDINEYDWPSVRIDVEAMLYEETEPLPIEVADLETLVASEPQGAVTSALNWEALDDDGFERVIFNLLSRAPGYENARWLMKTRAPDRGRDLSVDRTLTDSLSGATRQRVIVQCKHWRSRSLNVSDCSTVVAQVLLSEPPRVDVLIIATSGRFTGDAVQWIERHNAEGKQPGIEMWPESHLEFLLAPRPTLVTELGLRRRT
jgi:hypothetical protein